MLWLSPSTVSAILASWYQARLHLTRRRQQRKQDFSLSPPQGPRGVRASPQEHREVSWPLRESQHHMPIPRSRFMGLVLPAGLIPLVLLVPRRGLSHSQRSATCHPRPTFIYNQIQVFTPGKGVQPLEHHQPISVLQQLVPASEASSAK